MVVARTKPAPMPTQPQSSAAALFTTLLLMVSLSVTSRSSTGLYGRNAAYYDQNLILFATGWKDGRFRFDRNGRLKLKWQ